MSAKQNIDSPHERRPFKDHGHMDVITLGTFTLGRGVFEPGWRWSDDVKPIAGTDSCQTHHTGMCPVRTDDHPLRRRDRDHGRTPGMSSTSSPDTTPGRSVRSPA